MNQRNWPYLLLLLTAVTVICPPAAAVLSLLGGRRAPWLWLLLAWVSWRLQPDPPLPDLTGVRAAVVGTVCEPAVANERGCRFAVEVHHWTDRIDAYGGRWLVDWKQGEAGQVALGESWWLRGRLVGFEPPAYPGDWDGRAYWARHGITQHLRVSEARFLRPPMDPVHHWRFRLTQRLSERLPPRRSGLLAAVVLGDGSRLTPELNQDFRRAGASHLLVASGTNVALLVAWLFWVGGRCGWGPGRCAGIGLWLVPLYVGLAGAAPAMVRAGAMGWLALLARWTGRCVDLGRSLALGSLGVLLWEPQFLYDVGFQLSFAAVASLAWISPAVSGWFPPKTPLRAPLVASLACTLGLMPVCLGTFHLFQPLAPLANLWLAPLVEGLLPAGLVLAGLDLLNPRLGHWLGRGMDYWLRLVEWSAHAWSVHSPQIEVPAPGWPGLLAWFWLLLLIFLGPRLLTVALAAATCLLACPRTPPEDLRLRWLLLGGQPACWLSSGRSQAMLLSSQEQRPWAERLRLSQGLPPFAPLLTLEGPSGYAEFGRGRLVARPGRLTYEDGGLRLGLVREPRDWDGLSWGLDSTGQWVWTGGQPHKVEKGQPWQLRRVHRQLWLEPWR